jgi:hypothetical protein
MIDAHARSGTFLTMLTTVAYSKILDHQYEHGLPTQPELELIRRTILGWKHPVGSSTELAQAVLTELGFSMSVKEGRILSLSRVRQEAKPKKPEDRSMVKLEPREVFFVSMANLIRARADASELDHFWPPDERLTADQLYESLRSIDQTKVPQSADILEIPYSFPLTNNAALAERLRPDCNGKPLFKHAEIMVISRYRSEKGLDPDRQPLASSFAVSEEEAFAELLWLSGLDEHEITAYGLTLERLSSATALCEMLQEITGDTYEIAVHEVPLPLRPSVKGQFEG